jgi:hypothetical protein
MDLAESSRSARSQHQRIENAVGEIRLAAIQVGRSMFDPDEWWRTNPIPARQIAEREYNFAGR